MPNKFMIFSASLFALLSLSQSAYAADSTINIKGYVRDNTCAVAPGSQSQVVDLLNNAVKQLYAVGEVTPVIPFNIELTPCGNSVTAVKVGFVGIADTNNQTLLALDPGSLNASGAGIQILDGARKPLALNATSNNMVWTPLVAGKNNTLHFYARLMASKLPVTAGHVRATATFTLEFQ
ncbi:MULTISPECIES: fimbrial protein [Providencia]|uniref:fimbrial protein n=1 Tax=Providencia TaxID=586 RepID=UPI0019811DC0|nr:MULTISPECIES: fimbrial protein [Providencia]MBN4866066.1 type 1 fimbrial protein [Providencia stuartii]MBN4875388.1 type 1 fimbrial protein [Providencia stuartii]MBN4880079.1 type 1 fimbrial protein [Providencia stuartii]MBN4884400.1 type 1 fimbrial protein [Providencia stuartii]